MKRILFLIIACIALHASVFGQSKINRAEWFVDTDPGVGNATLLANYTTAVDSIDNNFNLNLSSLSLNVGIHYLYIRSRNTDGAWSLTQTKPFYVLNNNGAIISNAEYFFDNDPGVGNGHSLSIATLSDSASVTTGINIGNISTGQHYLYVRMKANGQWGLTQFKPFYVSAGSGAIITNAEYFFDNDPGAGNGLPFSISAAADSATFNGGINVGNLSVGLHYAYIRMKANGQWGLTQFKSFFVTQSTGPVTWHGEYFIDTDLGVGNGTAFSAVGTADSVNYAGNFNVGNIKGGQHILYVRYKNANNEWGLTQAVSFTSNHAVAAAEYFFDNDPGVGNGHPISVSTPSDSIAFTQNISMQTAGIGFGKHWLYVRAKNELGEWGLTQRDSMYILRPANDHCDGASPLTLGTNICGVSVSSSTFATDTSHVTVGVCNTSIEQGDVWFYAIAPANGNIEFDASQVATQSLKKGNLQAFTGSCGSLTTVGCSNFDSSATGRLILTGLTPNDTIRVRVMGRSSYEGNFDICAFTFANTLSVSATDTIICNGNSTTITASAYSGSLFSWSPNVALNTTTGATVIANPTSTTTYTITSQLSNSTLTKTIVIHVTPLVISASANNSVICNGNSATLTATGGTSYTWMPGNLSSASISVSPSSNTTYTVTGVNGGCSSTDTVHVNVFNDVTPPTISACATALNINTTAGLCGATGVSLGLPTATDNCTTTGNLTFINNAPTQFSVGSTTVNWIVKDAANNQSTCSQTVTVSDNELPQITCPANKNVNVNSGLCYATGLSLGTPLTSDNCGVQSFSNNAPTQFNVGNTNVTWIVIDVHGNQNTCTQIASVTDNIKPQITCGSSISVNADLNACGYYSANLTAPTATDNCSVVVSNNAPTVLPIGVSSIHWYATDASGNVDSCSQIVTVKNVTPTIIANGSTTFCNGGSVQLSCNASTGLQWYLNGNPISGATSNAYTATASGNYEIHQSVGSCNRISNSITITVHPNPTANAGIDQTILQGSAATLTATGGGTYSWNTGNVADTTASIIVSPIATTTYIVTVANNFGCTAKDTVVVHVNFSSLAVAPSFYNYGNVVLNTPTNHNITLTNNGTLPITINSVTTQAPYSVSFTSQSLSAGNSINIPVTFTPTGTLIYVKNVVINTSLGNFNVTLQGKGVVAAPSWSVSPNTYNYGNVNLGNSGLHAFTITNLGNVPITLTSTSSNNSVFTGSLSATIGVGGNANLLVNFIPTSVTTYSGVITLNTSTSNLSALSLNLQGTGFQSGTPPVIQYSSVFPYNSTVGVNPAVGTPGTYTYRIVYKHPNNRPPQNGYPKVGIDANADGDFIDAGEGVYSMNKISNTTNWVTGEEYTFSTNLSISNNYGYKFFAYDSLGNKALSIDTFYKVGPTVTNQNLDLSIFANDITFSVTNPAVNQAFTVYATVHNNTPYSASNVNIRFYTDSIYYNQTTLPYIGPNSTAQVSMNFSYNANGFFPIKVWIDSAHALTAETNVLNNYAIRPIIVGQFTVPGALNISATAYPQSCPVGGVVISGNAWYTGLNLSGTPPVLGGTVTVNIGGTNVSTYTATDGSWSVFYNNSGYGLATNTPISYTVTITDYTLTGTTTTTTFTIPYVNCNPPTGGSGSGGTSYSYPYYYPGPSVPSCIVNNQTFNYTIPVSNTGSGKSYQDTVRVYVDGNLSFTHIKDSILSGQTITYTDGFTLLAGTHTLSYIHKYKDAYGNNYSSNSSTVIYVQPALPDLYLGSYAQTGGTSFHVYNIDGSCTSAPSSKVLIYDSMSAYPNYVLIDSINSSAIAAGNSVLLNYSNPTLAQGFHYLILKTDGRNNIAELNEFNNTMNAVLYVPMPDLYVQYINVSNNNVHAGNQMNFIAVVKNQGANCSAFKVRFKVNGSNMGNKIIVGAGLNSGDSAIVVSDVFTVPIDSCPYLITAIADVDNQVNELNENNDSLNYIFGRDLTSGLYCSYNYAPLGAACNPYIVPVGGTLNITSVVNNIGLRDADTVHVQFKIGTTVIGTDNIYHIGANSYATTYLAHTFPTVGNYVITIVPDYDNKICEVDESNNLGYIYVNVLTALPDLRILSQDVSPSNLNPNPNQTVSIVCSIHNIGQAASTPTNVRFWVNNVQLGVDVPINTIYPGQDTTVAATATYSSSTVGPKIVKVNADNQQTVTETDESNNEATRAIIVGAAPDMAHSMYQAIHLPSSFRFGDTIQICNNIRNYGGASGTAWMKFYYRAGVTKTLIDSVQFSRNAADSSDVCKSWIVNQHHGTIITEIVYCNPQEFNVLNNVDSIEFNAGPKLKVAININPLLACSGSTVNMSSSIQSEGQTLNYQWYHATSTVGSNAPIYAVSNVALTDSGNYYLVVTDTFGNRTSAIKKLKVITTLTPTLSITASSNNVCSGVGITFTANPTNGGSLPAYQWKINGNNVGANSTTYSSSALQNGDLVSCVMTANNLCQSTSTATSGNINMVINNCGNVSIPTNGTPCTANNMSSNIGSLANSVQVFAYNNGVDPGLVNDDPNGTGTGLCYTASTIPASSVAGTYKPVAANLVYMQGNTALAYSTTNTPMPPTISNTGNTQKVVWFSFNAPTVYDATVDLNMNFANSATYSSTTQQSNWIIALYTLTGGTPCTSPVFTPIYYNSTTSPIYTTTGKVTITGADFSYNNLAGQPVYAELMLPSGAGGNYLMAIHASVPNITLQNPTTSTLTATWSGPFLGVNQQKLSWRARPNPATNWCQTVLNLPGYTFTYVPTNSTSYTINSLISGNIYDAWMTYYGTNNNIYHSKTVTLGATTSTKYFTSSRSLLKRHCANSYNSYYQYSINIILSISSVLV